jgi:hypothetical protein
VPETRFAQVMEAGPALEADYTPVWSQAELLRFFLRFDLARSQPVLSGWLSVSFVGAGVLSAVLTILAQGPTNPIP